MFGKDRSNVIKHQRETHDQKRRQDHLQFGSFLVNFYKYNPPQVSFLQ